MAKQVWRKGRIVLAGICGVVALTLLAMWGCGTSGYDNPSAAVVTTKTATALIQAADLKRWADAGLVNKAGGYDRVVILEVTTNTNNYNGEHIPGAISVNRATDIAVQRVEGPALTGDLVADGKMMDALIQRCGIDQNTTIVFTTSEAEMNADNHYNLTRGYATFRYWGFPKERLKVLDGGNKAWKAAGLPMTTIVPGIKSSTYCVTPDNTNRVRDDLRATLSDMIKAVQAVQAGTATYDFIDGRADGVPGETQDIIDTTLTGPTYDTTTTPPTIKSVGGLKKDVVFEGQVKGGRGYAYSNLRDVTTRKFKSISDVIAGLDLQKPTTYVMCRSGNIATVLFFAIDGYAFYDGSKKAVWYDGSWGQWGLMATSDQLTTAGIIAGGKLPVGSAWSTVSLTNILSYNKDNTLRTVIDITSRLAPVSHADVNANQTEEADKAYRSPVSTSGGGATVGGGGGGC
ncbi:selenite/tellurite reduction operon rhodanese-like protein ExtH [Geotalea uraniireducens]|uniref:Rhodanese domain protein n=1 Tax=Geotalea uraniireducens (strain Rf4) TaxID=351605 RepID=A5GCM9_GEOUR|nr:selenite/tellurite reduction operon rhodanese-like protein ExtH [Geotalea uraniireducens]ABQ24666.1 Rhodanese domain protein [Geotalea uraniireducens Rf4]